MLVVVLGDWGLNWDNLLVQKWCFWTNFWVSRVESRGHVSYAAARVPEMP